MYIQSKCICIYIYCIYTYTFTLYMYTYTHIVRMYMYIYKKIQVIQILRLLRHWKYHPPRHTDKQLHTHTHTQAQPPDRFSKSHILVFTSNDHLSVAAGVPETPPRVYIYTYICTHTHIICMYVHMHKQYRSSKSYCCSECRWNITQS